MRVGNAPSIASGALLIAIERGYFREVGIKVVIDPLDSAANAIALLAQNQYQIIEGGIAAGHSVGELAAGAIAGVLTPEDAMRLVAVRSQAMARAAAAEETGMTAVLGGDESALAAPIRVL